jgi:uncharacterized protein (DUF1501 family)
MTQSRRDFIKTTFKAGALFSFAASAPRFLTRAAMASSSRGDGGTVLVMLQLSGGNDGLNTVIPFADDAYFRARPTLSQVAAKAHRLDSQIALHPRMDALAGLFKEGGVAIVQGVGYPDQDRDHTRGMRNWQTAQPKTADAQTGWLGRAADRLWNPAGGNLPAAFVGAIPQPFGSNAEQVIVPSIESLRDLVCQPPPLANAQAAGADGSLLDFLRRETAQVADNNRRLEKVLASSAGAGGYPEFTLASELRTIAQLLRADLGIRIFYTETGSGGIGGFDNHAGQLGNHCSLLHQLSESITAFMRDLRRDRLADRVVLMTFSEFGRTVRENGRRGTDHGSAAPVLVAGGRVKGGVVGAHPSLTDLDRDGLKHHTDFRQLYATALDRWLGMESRGVLGASFTPVDIFNA